MKLEELIDFTADQLVNRIQSSNALAIFATRRAKFEGWLKVELIDILISNGLKAVPEEGLIDVSFDNTAIELKTINTNYRDGIAEIKGRPITKNIKSVINDIQKHRQNKFPNKFVIFIVFPLGDRHTNWSNHLKKIEHELGEVCQKRVFEFKNAGVKGVLYYGKVND